MTHDARDVDRNPGPPPGALPGVVVRAYGKFFSVALADGRELLSTIKGVLKRQRRGTDLVAVGDRVLVTDVGEGEGRIESVEPRTSTLSRLARQTNDVEQIILANPDQALFVFAVRDPEPHLRLLDRFLVMAESRQLPALIGVNKMDLDHTGADGEPSLARSMFGHYEEIYPVFYLSAKTGQGIDELRQALNGKITAFAGPSGVGKSSLLNVLDPTRDRLVGDISAATGKGRHTTTATVLHRIPGETQTFVADTPGIRALSLQGVGPTSSTNFSRRCGRFWGNADSPIARTCQNRGAPSWPRLTPVRSGDNATRVTRVCVEEISPTRAEPG